MTLVTKIEKIEKDLMLNSKEFTLHAAKDQKKKKDNVTSKLSSMMYILWWALENAVMSHPFSLKKVPEGERKSETKYERFVSSPGREYQQRVGDDKG